MKRRSVAVTRCRRASLPPQPRVRVTKSSTGSLRCRIAYDSKLCGASNTASAPAAASWQTAPSRRLQKIFTERPIVVTKGGAAAIAKAVLSLDRFSHDFLAASWLHSPVERDKAGFGPWAAGIAANNVHGAGGNLIDPSADRRRARLARIDDDARVLPELRDAHCQRFRWKPHQLAHGASAVGRRAVVHFAGRVPADRDTP